MGRFTFTVAWAQFLYPMAFLVSSDQMVLTVGIVSDLISTHARKNIFGYRMMAFSLH